MNRLEPATSGVDVDGLIGRRVAGFSLEAPFYTDPALYSLDLSRVFGRHWLYCAAEAEIAEPGAFVTMDVGPFSVIVIRDETGVIRAHHNVCRHRGARVVQQPRGETGNLVCPYHQWTYRPDGSLIFADAQAPDFDKCQYGLRPVHVRTLAGLVFICFADEAPSDFDAMSHALAPYLERYELASAKVAYQEDIIQGGNWKLALENNRECRYNEAAHPDLAHSYFPVFGYSENDVAPQLRPVFARYQAASERLDSVCAQAAFPREELREIDTTRTAYYISHHPLDGDGSSFGPHGEPLCSKLMGSVPVAAFGDLSLKFQPNGWFHFLSDHAVLSRLVPRDPTSCVLRTTWLVHPDAVEGRDYDRETLTRSWRLTNEQDCALIAQAQRGVEDPAYLPGPYSLVEDDIEASVRWYLAAVDGVSS